MSTVEASQLIRITDGKEGEETELPGPSETTTFWSKICSEEVSHNGRASWLEEVEQQLSSTEIQENIDITVEDIKTGVKKMASRNAAGPDPVQGCWCTKLTGILPRLQEYLQHCVPDWMVRGEHIFIQKNPAKGTEASNYRPKSCLPMMYVEAVDRNNGREVIPSLAEEWTANR